MTKNGRSDKNALLIRHLGTQPYEPVWQSMKQLTHNRTRSAEDRLLIDELWSVQHPPVYTQGQAGKAEHLLAPGNIPVIKSDRGGQVTYHGPGQIVIYFLIDLRRKGLGVRDLVSKIEDSIIALLKEFDIDANADRKAPGVYVNGAKVASLGLRIRKACSYHGLSLNTDMDLEPFDRINPCGFQGLKIIQMKDLVSLELSRNADFIGNIENRLLAQLVSHLAYNKAQDTNRFPSP
ncbi:MAG: lipoyl(octanoyl) transferase LipB [Pseudomonadales bacterium]|nr:lipoyl(octanoyl) transferase LipB [Pseudomonadales bacterium]